MEPDTSPHNNSNKDLTSQEAKLLGTFDTNIILRKTVFLLTDKRKVNEKLIFITKNRLFVRSHKTPTKLDMSVNLLRIRSITCKDPKHVTVGVEKMFGSPVGSKADVVVTNLDFIVETVDQEELVVALLTPLKPLGMWHDRIQLTIEQKESSIKVSDKYVVKIVIQCNQGCLGYTIRS
ncbi:hypothetical protein LOD99_2969 [Oopsacas minuta]|uniref:CARMIL pleckstrin homology domain-containing protein n=1 Tax=Oopsacas minuta TaxID=111878 RepID=A0AAV7K0K9_9METZ|nr:hypothetical protein LOD99_2969 [Oopsacas minuta]